MDYLSAIVHKYRTSYITVNRQKCNTCTLIFFDVFFGDVWCEVLATTGSAAACCTEAPAPGVEAEVFTTRGASANFLKI